MLMNDEIIFDLCTHERNTCTGALYLTASSHFIRVKDVIFMFVPGGLRLLIISTCFAWRPVTSINKSHVLTACAHENCY